MKDTLRAWREIIRFNKLSLDERAVVFYAEDAASRVHFAPIIEELLKQKQRIAYLTSAPDDPILTEETPDVAAFYIGMGLSRTFLFSVLKSQTLVMTMPDLQRFHIRRSRVYPVHYVYVFHSMVSTTMIYREGAFDHYDTILSVGPLHTREIRATEASSQLAAKNIVEHGYGRLDSILKNVRPRKKNQRAVVLIAPSYGKHSLLEVCGVLLIESLLAGGSSVICRPHPITTAKSHATMRDLRSRFSQHRLFKLETDVGSQDSLHQSDLMISDWSGAALEYAFGRLKPVLFVDVPRKVNNPNYQTIGITPIEVEIRSQIGRILSPADLGRACDVVKDLYENAEFYSKRIERLRGELIANVGLSGRVGAEAILEIIGRLSPVESRSSRTSPVGVGS